MQIGDPLPQQWRVILNDGGVLGLWADGCSEREGYYDFGILADASAEEQKDPDLVIDGETPSNPERISFVVARVPMGSVAEIRSEDWPD